MQNAVPVEDTLRQRRVPPTPPIPAPLVPRRSSAPRSSWETRELSVSKSEGRLPPILMPVDPSGLGAHLLSGRKHQSQSSAEVTLASAPAAPSGGRWSHRAQPDLSGRIRAAGWTEVRNGGSTVWAAEARQLATWRASAGMQGHSSFVPGAGDGSSSSVGPGVDEAVNDRLQLLGHLDRGIVRRGPDALEEALCWRCGSLGRAVPLCGLDRESGLALFEFAGTLALLGLPAQKLCGHGEREALQHLSVRLHLGAAVADSSEADPAVLDKWVQVAKFLALSAWFGTPPPLRRRERHSASDGPAAAPPKRKHGQHAQCDGLVLSLVQSEGALPADSGQTPGYRTHLVPNLCDFWQLQAAMQIEHNASSSSQQFAQQLMSRADLFRYVCDDMPIAGIEETQLLTRSKIGEIYDAVLSAQMQRASTAGDVHVCTKGLTFESFRLVLMRIFCTLGLPFAGLCDDAIEVHMLGAGLYDPTASVASAQPRAISCGLGKLELGRHLAQ